MFQTTNQLNVLVYLQLNLKAWGMVGDGFHDSKISKRTLKLAGGFRCSMQLGQGSSLIQLDAPSTKNLATTTREKTSSFNLQNDGPLNDHIIQIHSPFFSPGTYWFEYTHHRDICRTAVTCPSASRKLQQKHLGFSGNNECLLKICLIEKNLIIHLKTLRLVSQTRLKSPKPHDSLAAQYPPYALHGPVSVTGWNASLQGAVSSGSWLWSSCSSTTLRRRRGD